MTSIKFTATVIRKDKGQYVARADELSISGETASTQRGAIKSLKMAVVVLLHEATEAGKLPALLDAAGYPGFLSGVSDITLECHIMDSVSVSVPLPRQPSRFDRTRTGHTTPASDREGNSHALV